MSDHPIQCKFCFKKFNFHNALLIHADNHHQDKDGPFLCSVCNKSFFSSQNRDQHQQCHASVKEFECRLCFRTFANLNYLKMHYVVHSNEKPYKCELCPKKVSRKVELQDHTRTHTREQPFECNECKKRFSQSLNLRTHIRTTHKNEKRHQCTICPKAFKRQRLLDYHITAKHTDNKLLTCTHCGKGFVYPQVFKNHNLICKSKPPAQEFYLAKTANDEQFVVQLINNNYYLVDPETRLPTKIRVSNFSTSLEQHGLAAIQTDDDQKLNKEIPSSSEQISERFALASKKNSEPNDEAHSRIDVNHISSSEPNIPLQETDTTQSEQPQEVFEVIFKGLDGNWYICDYVKKTHDDSISLKELQKMAAEKYSLKMQLQKERKTKT